MRYRRWLPVAIVLAFMYAPFVLKYGWGYRDIRTADLPSFYSASVAVFEHGESPYDRERLQSLMGQDVQVFPYLYPPPTLLLFYPLTMFDYVTAQRVVLVINHLIVLGLLWVIPRYLLRASTEIGFALAAVVVLTFHPIVVTLDHGQVNLLLLAFLLAFWLLARAGRPLTASFFLAAAVLLKTYPALLLPLLFVSGRRRECGYATAWIGLGTAISLLLIPSTVWQDWFVNVLPSGGFGRTPPGLFSPAVSWNQSLNGYLTRVLGESGGPLVYAVAGLVAAISGAAVWRGSKVHADNLDRTMIVGLPLMYLLAPFSWEHHLVYLLPSALLVMTARVMFHPGKALLFYVIGIGAALLIGLDALSRIKLYGVVALWGLSVLVALSRDVHLVNEDIA